MKIYVAGKWEDRDQVRLVHQELRRLGHEITVDWTDHDYPTDDIESILESYTLDDIWGVKEADLFIALMTVNYLYKGAWVEMGVALGKGIPVLVIGKAGDSCIFMNHPLVRKLDSFSDLEEALMGSKK